ncbi:hypothetical protein J2125_000781 [Erwinia toletana]|uniref:Uncharacterized protein n=1 Tax=Winslowiella toletana TaxID=92490 RepID=A0ABS4P4P9_9GAMM|nr:hypothetical protein [Winslowiella toletana]
MQNIVLLVVLIGLVIYSGHKYYKQTRAKTLTRQRHR